MNIDISPATCRAARGLLDWTQSKLATAASVGLSTVKGFEGGNGKPIANNRTAIRAALEAAGIEFTNGDAPGVRLRVPGAAPAPADDPAAPAAPQAPPALRAATPAAARQASPPVPPAAEPDGTPKGKPSRLPVPPRRL